MGKVLKNIHWAIIAYAAFTFYNLYEEHTLKLSGAEAQLEGLKTTLTASKKSQREISNYYKNIKEEKAKIERVANEIEKMQQLLPVETSDNENVHLIRTMADDVNIKELSIAPEQEINRGFFIARTYRIKVKATFLQMLIMFEKIGESKRILNISEVSFKKTDEPQRGKFQIIMGEVVLEAYRYNPVFKEDRGIETIEKQFNENKPPPPRPEKPNKEEV